MNILTAAIGLVGFMICVLDIMAQIRNAATRALPRFIGPDLIEKKRCGRGVFTSWGMAN